MNQSDPKKHRYHPVPAHSEAGKGQLGEADEARMANEGGTEGLVGDTGGPGAGYDGEPVQVKDRGGVK